MRLPHGWTNDTTADGAVVEKRYVGPGAVARAACERRTLTALAGRLPVPLVRSWDADPPVVRLERLPGGHGQDLLGEGRGVAVLATCGRLLRSVQAVPPAMLPHLDGAGPVLVHGDFGPQNLLLSADGDGAVALLDWEFARRGERHEDLAWAEWIVRTHHPDAVAALDALFEGYGERPPWPRRHEAMPAACRSQLHRARSGSDGAAAALWTSRLAATERYRERA